MGVSFEINWYLVTGDKSIIEDMNEMGKVVSMTKDGLRVYPVGVKLPIIVKEHGCVGMGLVKSVVQTEDETTVSVMITDKFSTDGEVSRHYYNMYINAKNKREVA